MPPPAVDPLSSGCGESRRGVGKADARYDLQLDRGRRKEILQIHKVDSVDLTVVAGIVTVLKDPRIEDSCLQKIPPPRRPAAVALFEALRRYPEGGPS